MAYVILVDLELDHSNIRKEGNIITYERNIILGISTLRDFLQHLSQYCPNEEMYYTAAETGRILHEMLAKLPCRVCSETTHSTLLGCKKLSKYITGHISETKRLPEEVCKLCLGTIFTECQHRRMVNYQDYLCHVSKMNFIICYLCKKHESAQNWFKMNHNPSKGIHNITNMNQAIGTEHV